jgi:hypothetical protein
VSSTQVSTSAHRFTRRRVRTAIVVGLCAPILAACSATGFGSPVRHAVANLQAATAKIGNNLEVQGVIIALPSGITSPKGGLAYLQFEAINFASQADGLVNVTAEPETAASLPASADSSTASVPPAAESLQRASDVIVPAATAAGPGTARISILLRNLTAPLTQGDSVVIGLSFGNSGSVSGLLVPVQGAAVVGTFLPTAPPPAPASSPVASPVTSPGAVGESPVASPAAGSSAPASAPAGSAPVSAPASPSAATSS